MKIKEKYLKKQSVHYKQCLKIVIEDACLVSAGRLSQSLAPRKEKHFCPLQMISLAIDHWKHGFTIRICCRRSP